MSGGEVGADAGAAGRAAGLLLAAGGGSRLGRTKALVELDGTTLVERGVAVCQAAGLSPVVVVVGAEADAVAERVRAAGGEPVTNPDWEQGMGSSMAVGLDALSGRTEAVAAVVAVLVDQPGVGPEAIRRVVGRWEEGATIAAGAYDGRRGHPVCFDASCLDALRGELSGDAGARGFLATRADQVVLVDCADVADDTDLDTPDDLARWRRRGP